MINSEVLTLATTMLSMESLIMSSAIINFIAEFAEWRDKFLSCRTLQFEDEEITITFDRHEKLFY